MSAEGKHTLIVKASDTAGNTATTTVHFTIDLTDPVLHISGVTDGEITRSAVTPAYSATDTNLGTVTATLNGADFASKTAVSTDGDYVLVVTATDKAGNTATNTISFSIDTAPPAITVSGVTDGQMSSQPVVILYSAADAHLNTLTATLDGVAFASGDTVSVEALHSLVVKATDKAGNSATSTTKFTIDSTPPTIKISGVAQGAIVRTAVTPTFSATDKNLASVTAKPTEQPSRAGQRLPWKVTTPSWSLRSTRRTIQRPRRSLSPSI